MVEFLSLRELEEGIKQNNKRLDYHLAELKKGSALEEIVSKGKLVSWAKWFGDKCYSSWDFDEFSNYYGE